jgi:hypothetical protein
MRSSWTIKRRLIIAFVALFATSTALMGVFAYRSAMNHLHEELKDLARNESRLFYTILTADAKGLARAQIGLSRLDPQLRLFAEKDRQGLLNATSPIFSDIRQKHNITHMYFIAPDGTVFLRMHKPEQFGDRYSRYRFAVVDATDIAREQGIGSSSVVIINTTIVGAYARLLGLPLSLLEEAYASLGLLGDLRKRLLEWLDELRDDLVRPVDEIVNNDVSMRTQKHILAILTYAMSIIQTDKLRGASSTNGNLFDFVCQNVVAKCIISNEC